MVEARDQTLLELRNVLGRLVRRDHDLLVGVAQGIERVEELLLRALLAGEELDVVDEEEVHVPVFVAEGESLRVLDGVDHLVGEALCGYVAHARIRTGREDGMPDGMQEMRLSEARAGEDEERVVCAAGTL